MFVLLVAMRRCYGNRKGEVAASPATPQAQEKGGSKRGPCGLLSRVSDSRPMQTQGGNKMAPEGNVKFFFHFLYMHAFPFVVRSILILYG